MASRIEELIATLDLRGHPEGGYYREIHRSAQSVEPGDGRGSRAALTLIWFLLPAGEVSRWHRVNSDEVWHHCEGAPLELLHALPDPWRLERSSLGPLPAHRTVHCVPAGTWQAARPLGEYTLVSCAVGPGFEFSDFELLGKDPGLAAELVGAIPDAAGFL